MPAPTLLLLPIGMAAVGFELIELANWQHSVLAGSAGLFLAFYAVKLLATGVLLRVELSPAGVRIRAGFSSRLVGWAQIRAVTIEQQRWGGPRVIVVGSTWPSVAVYISAPLLVFRLQRP